MILYTSNCFGLQHITTVIIYFCCSKRLNKSTIMITKRRFGMSQASTIMKNGSICRRFTRGSLSWSVYFFFFFYQCNNNECYSRVFKILLIMCWMATAWSINKVFNGNTWISKSCITLHTIVYTTLIYSLIKKTGFFYAKIS